MVRAKIIVVQKTVTFHFWGLHFFKKNPNPYYDHIHWSKCPQYKDTRAHLKCWFSPRSQPFQEFLWLNIDFASSQGSLIYLGEFSRPGLGWESIFSSLQWHNRPLPMSENCLRGQSISHRGRWVVKVLDFRKLPTSRIEAQKDLEGGLKNQKQA